MANLWDIQLRGLRIGYGDTVVLDNVEASIPGGKITVILGGSGCGKSTLLRHIIGLQRPMAGRIVVGGHDIFSIPAKQFRRIRRRMGVLFQDGALLGSLTVAQNVSLPLREHTALSDDSIRRVAVHKLALVGLAPFADYYPTELSGGMRKRAGLARALVTDPPILLCDEPTSGLDPVSAAQMDALLLDMKSRFPEMTIVAVSHDLASLGAIAEHVLVLHQGTLLYTGDLAGLHASDNPYLHQFLHRKGTPETDGQAPKGPEVALPETALDEETQTLVRAALAAWV